VRIAVISVAPVFPNFVIGGSQKILSDVAVGLQRAGHETQIWCTSSPVHSGDFEIDGITIHPDLKLRGSFPATHQVSPVQLQQTADALRLAADWADRVYLHADAVYLRHAIEGAEIIRSIHDYVYEEALLSTLTLPASATIVPSQYLKNCIEATVAISGRSSIEPVVVVPNGVQVAQGRQEPRLPNGVNARGSNDLLLLFPHRPEPTKGTREAISTAVEVQRLTPARNVRLLMPAYPVGSHLDDSAGSTVEIQRTIEELGAESIVELHSWLSPDEMPRYLAAGDVALCLGSFVESFGLVPVESVISGTAVVCVRVGALREFADIDGVTMVAYGDIHAAAEAVLSASQLDSQVLNSGRSQVSVRYGYQQMIDGYESIITGTLSPARPIVRPEGDFFELAPWCDVQSDSIYDDYTAESREFPELIRELQLNENRVSSDVMTSNPLLADEIAEAETLGILNPKFDIE
jgi:glycosyltransferase involved in cell wall biosynthesis